VRLGYGAVKKKEVSIMGEERAMSLTRMSIASRLNVHI